MFNVSVHTVSGKSLAVAFENALTNLHQKGIRYKTQYSKPGKPESIDCTLNLTVEQAEGEPMINQFNKEVILDEISTKAGKTVKLGYGKR
ncbi:MAG: hypothetical protein ACERKD_08220 [Prolixibacteraceae bacterium]